MRQLLKFINYCTELGVKLKNSWDEMRVRKQIKIIHASLKLNSELKKQGSRERGCNPAN